MSGELSAPQIGRRVAFFGGSFDPPHLGHLAIARAARDAFHLDRVLFAPVGAQPLKPEGSSASFEDRLAMTRLAIENEPGFELSLADAPKSSPARSPQQPPDYSPNYTIDTLEGLRAEFGPACALYCLMGADAFFGLRRWHRAAEIPYAAALIVASRPPILDRNSRWTAQVSRWTSCHLRSRPGSRLNLRRTPSGTNPIATNPAPMSPALPSAPSLS
jgi:nicotinate (nicotinamide) nucleotide adenylyltransferase